MRIVIEYDSCWQTGFLDGDSNLPVSNKDNPRKFVATSGTRGETSTPISDDTVLGVMSRLIGDQRKLYQIRQSGNCYFSDIQGNMTWRVLTEQTATELMYLTNKSDDRCAKGVWLGVVPDDSPWFFSEHAYLLWSTLYLKRDELIEFIESKEAFKPSDIKIVDCRPKSLLTRLDKVLDIKGKEGSPWKTCDRINSERSKLIERIGSESEKKAELLEKYASKPRKTDKQIRSHHDKLAALEERINSLNSDVESLGGVAECKAVENRLLRIVDLLVEKFPGNEYWSDGILYPFRLYAAALYLQVERLIGAGYDFDFALNKKGEIQIQGFSKRGFNGVRDWLNPISGGRKKAVGTPCNVNKQSGRLEINLEIDRERAFELKTMIENAGVSSFYLGKKGLAYVSDIRV